jgi:hypothetical protein
MNRKRLSAYSENKTKQEAKKEKVPLPGIEPGSPG